MREDVSVGSEWILVTVPDEAVRVELLETKEPSGTTDKLKFKILLRASSEQLRLASSIHQCSGYQPGVIQTYSGGSIDMSCAYRNKMTILIYKFQKNSHPTQNVPCSFWRSIDNDYPESSILKIHISNV